MSTKQGTVTSLGLLILRVGFGVYMMTHGWGKVQMVMDGEFGEMDPIGLGPKMSMIFAAAAEFGGALLVVLGLGTRFGAAAVAFTMGVAAFVVHANDPWTMSAAGNGKEPALLFMTAFLSLVFTGAGRFSVDAWLWNKRKAKKAA
ncbi:MAG: DoxX family protein [Planctomycetota bacterium]